MNRSLLAVIFLTLASFNGYAQTLLNPSFEDQGSATDLAANWNRWGNWMNRETGWTTTHDGVAMMGYHHWQIEDAQTSGFWQDIQGVKSGQNFTFSIWAYWDGVQNGNGPVSMELRLEATVNNNQVTIASSTTNVKDITQGQWIQFHVSGKTPNNTLRVLVAVTPAASAPRDGALKFDDASLVLGSDQNGSAAASPAPAPVSSTGTH